MNKKQSDELLLAVTRLIQTLGDGKKRKKSSTSTKKKKKKKKRTKQPYIVSPKSAFTYYALAMQTSDGDHRVTS